MMTREEGNQSSNKYEAEFQCHFYPKIAEKVVILQNSFMA